MALVNMKPLAGLAIGLVLAFFLPLLLAQDPPKGDAKAGSMIFEDKCTECHDSDSEETKTGPGLKGVKEGKLPSGRKSNRENILEILTEGRDEMPPFKDVLTEKQKEDVIAFVLTL